MGWRRTKPAQYTEGKTQSQQHYWSEHPYLISGAWLRPRAHISEVPAQNPLLVLLAPHQHTGTATCAKGQYFGAWLLLSQESWCQKLESSKLWNLELKHKLEDVVFYGKNQPPSCFPRDSALCHLCHDNPNSWLNARCFVLRVITAHGTQEWSAGYTAPATGQGSQDLQ